MSDVYTRLRCASANDQRATVDADEMRALASLYRHSPEAPPTPKGPFHLNEYLTDRAFGGPEEGGWWYDTGRPVACHGVYATLDEASAARDALRAYLAERREGRHDPSSVLCTGWPALRVEPHPGADFPAARPRYE